MSKDLLYKIELTSSQLKTLNTIFSYALMCFEYKSYLSAEREKGLALVEAIKMQTVEGEEI